MLRGIVDAVGFREVEWISGRISALVLDPERLNTPIGLLLVDSIVLRAGLNTGVHHAFDSIPACDSGAIRVCIPDFLSEMFRLLIDVR